MKQTNGSLDNTNNNNGESRRQFTIRIQKLMMSNEDELITVGVIIGFAAGVAAMIMITN